MGQRPWQTLPHRRYTRGKWAYEKILPSHVIREMQIETTMRHLCTPNRMAHVQKTDHAAFWQGWGTTEPLLHCWRGCRRVRALWRTVCSQKIRGSRVRGETGVPLTAKAAASASGSLFVRAPRLTALAGTSGTMLWNSAPSLGFKLCNDAPAFRRRVWYHLFVLLRQSLFILIFIMKMRLNFAKVFYPSVDLIILFPSIPPSPSLNPSFLRIAVMGTKVTLAYHS